MGGRDKQRVPADELMEDLEVYMNKIIEFSPLICNLFFLRDFLTSRPDQQTVSPDHETHEPHMTKDNFTPNLMILAGLKDEQIGLSDIGLGMNYTEQSNSFNNSLKFIGKGQGGSKDD